MLTMKAVNNRSSKVLRFLCFDWIQDPEEVLNEKLKTVGLESEYLETDLKLFEFFRKELYWSLDREYYPLLDLVVPAHFRWQITVMWLLIKCRPTNDSTFDYTCRAILPPSSAEGAEKELVNEKNMKK